MRRTGLLALIAALTVTACAERRVAPATAPTPAGKAAVPEGTPRDASPAGNRPDDRGEGRRVVTGLASYYGQAFDGNKTASGRIFDMDELVAAHPSYPFGTRVRVTNLENGRSVVVRVIDRGPTQENVNEGVIIDLSRRAAAVLGFISDGRQRVRLEILEWGNGT